ncbi:helix-turn-helix domain-containing protein [Flagellimonas algicola]|uniref:AraC family transcriptional regulator n=1 Tax=Flagellimonas algicola TaxID=2583815 RepID=A0ABY2WN13_9FLAO|nr:helix-turn-helix domain-containing protein [Allomuricauda algicola]TMU56388.1 AraC family transcriptional regulator [Allomuricauda algicola]
MYKSACVILCFLLNCVVAFAQEYGEKPLFDLNYNELRQKWSQDGETYRNTYFDYHISKAKREKDTLQLAIAYRLKSWDLDYSVGLKTLDTAFAIINAIQNKQGQDYFYFKSMAYYTQAHLYYNDHQDAQAVYAMINCLYWSKKAKNHKIVARSSSHLGNLKAEFGQESEGIVFSKKALKYLDKYKTHIDDYDYNKTLCLHNMARCYAYARKTDSARSYLKKAIKSALTIKDSSEFEDLQVLRAQLDYYDGLYNRSRDTLILYIQDARGTSKADKFYYLGMIEGQIGKSYLKTSYFKSYDSILKNLDYPLFDNANQVYQHLLKEAINQNDNKAEKEYLHRLVYYDSLLTDTQERIREITLNELDLPLEMEEKSSLSQAINRRNKLLIVFYTVSAVLLIGCTGYYLKYRGTRQRLAKVMSQPVQVEKRQAKGIQNTDDKLDTQMLSTVLDSLNLWEKELGFLDGSVTQHDLAKMIKTNSTYLSQTINHYKGQNFSSYLKDIRITYAINHLKENPTMAKSMSMIQIAEYYGFNSLPVFTKSLKRKIAVTPGVFIKQLVKEI